MCDGVDSSQAVEGNKLRRDDWSVDGCQAPSVRLAVAPCTAQACVCVFHLEGANIQFNNTFIMAQSSKGNKTQVSVNDRRFSSTTTI